MDGKAIPMKIRTDLNLFLLSLSKKKIVRKLGKVGFTFFFLDIFSSPAYNSLRKITEYQHILRDGGRGPFIKILSTRDREKNLGRMWKIKIAMKRQRTIY